MKEKMKDIIITYEEQLTIRRQFIGLTNLLESKGILTLKRRIEDETLSPESPESELDSKSHR